MHPRHPVDGGPGFALACRCPFFSLQPSCPYFLLLCYPLPGLSWECTDAFSPQQGRGTRTQGAEDCQEEARKLSHSLGCGILQLAGITRSPDVVFEIPDLNFVPTPSQKAPLTPIC